jgi:hypothetical protein
MRDIGEGPGSKENKGKKERMKRRENRVSVKEEQP